MSEHPDEKRSDNHLSVAVVTTSGRWPPTNFEKVSTHQKVRRVLEDAAKHLHLAGTSDWIATAGAKPLKPDETFEANGFTTGEVVIDFGPRQGGGGRA